MGVVREKGTSREQEDRLPERAALLTSVMAQTHDGVLDALQEATLQPTSAVFGHVEDGELGVYGPETWREGLLCAAAPAAVAGLPHARVTNRIHTAHLCHRPTLC